MLGHSGTCELADQNFRKAYWDYQQLLEVIDDPTNSSLKRFKQCLDEVHQKILSFLP